jgi:hypothetical protein
MAAANQIELNRPTQWLFWCIMAYFVMNGAQILETAVMVPAWTAAPPSTLYFFQKPYGLDFKVFWITVHSLHEIIFIVALVLNWKDKQRRKPLLLLFIAHMVVRVWTVSYFAPTIIWFQSLPVTDAVDEVLVQKAALWKNLNYLRVGLFIAINMLMVPLLKTNKQAQHV